MKKQITTAMAVAMAFGTVVPAFATDVTRAELDTDKFTGGEANARIAAGEKLVIINDKEVHRRKDVFNIKVDNTPFDRTDDELMHEYAHYTAKVVEFNEDDPYNDFIVLTEKDDEIGDSVIEEEQNEIKRIETEIADIQRIFTSYDVVLTETLPDINDDGKDYISGSKTWKVYDGLSDAKKELATANTALKSEVDTVMGVVEDNLENLKSISESGNKEFTNKLNDIMLILQEILTKLENIDTIETPEELKKLEDLMSQIDILSAEIDNKFKLLGPNDRPKIEKYLTTINENINNLRKDVNSIEEKYTAVELNKPILTYTISNIDEQVEEVPGTPTDKLADQLREEVFGLKKLTGYEYDFKYNTLDKYENNNEDNKLDIRYPYGWSHNPDFDERIYDSKDKVEMYRTYKSLLDTIEKNIDKFDKFVDEGKGDEHKNEVVSIYPKGIADKDKTDENLVLRYVVENKDSYNDGFLVDIPEENDFSKHWAYDLIKEAMLSGEVVLTDTFRPNDSITRAEFAKMITTIYGGYSEIEAVEEYEKGEHRETFSDVASNSWYAPYIAYVQTEGIARGTETDVKFSPNEPITRQEAAVMVANIAEVKGMNYDKYGCPTLYNKYKDIDGKNMYDANGDGVLDTHKRVQNSELKDMGKADAWADHAIDALYNAKYTKDGETKYIMRGYSDFTFKPQNEITRAETLALLNQLRDHNEYQSDKHFHGAR